MNRFRRLSVVLCYAAFAIDAASAGQNALEKEPYGYFRPAAKLPHGFADLAELHLSGAGEYGARATPPYLGQLKMKGSRGKSFQIHERTIEGLQIRFTTKTVGRQSYSFDGAFARHEFHDGGVPLDEVMLSGTLTKHRDGKRNGSAKVGFVFEAGG